MRPTGPDLQNILTGLVVAIVGFFSSFAIVLQGLDAMGASHAEAASGLMAAAVSMGLAGMVLAWWKKQPISVAWSTPGVALLAATPMLSDGFGGAVAGFIGAGLLTVFAGLWKPLGKLATSVPPVLAQAMLAGVLATLCTAPFRALAEVPQTALPILLTWFVAGRINRLFAVPAAVVAAAIVTLVANDFSLDLSDGIVTTPVLTLPVFSTEALLSVALPLFVVTMATQNIPAIAVLKSFGYTPVPGPLFTGVGLFSVASAPLGAPATCLAAITAALCSNDDSHPDRHRRFWSAIMAGLFYCLFGLFAVMITAIAAQAPAMTLQTLAGVALLGVFANSTASALAEPESREAAAVTFLVTASGMTLWGLGAAVWGLILGGVVLGVTRRSRT